MPLADRDDDGELSVEEWVTAAVEFHTATNPEAPGNRLLGRF
ncbi:MULTISPECIES: hypothetical protein [Streptomyces]